MARKPASDTLTTSDATESGVQPVASTDLEQVSITIAGRDFNVPVRYSEGHALTAGEASALNQTLHENLRNNFAKRVKEAEEGVDLQAELDAYAAAYQFGERSGGGRTSDPVKRQAIQIAVNSIEQAIKDKGGKVGDYPREQIRELAQKLVTDDPRFMEQARQDIERARTIAQSLGLPEPSNGNGNDEGEVSTSETFETATA